MGWCGFVPAYRRTLERLARVVHDRDGYPIYLPTDLQAFLVFADAYGAWVAEQDRQLLGHVRSTSGHGMASWSWDGERPVSGTMAWP
jgi:hypothetical protein